MTRNRALPLAMLCLALAGSTLPLAAAEAREHGGRDRDRPERAHAEHAISLDEAVARAERQYKARAVRAEEKRRGDRIEYRIRLLGDDGRVFEVRVDATTGREG